MKMIKRGTLFAIGIFFISNSIWAQTDPLELIVMNQEKLEKIIKDKAGTSEGANGQVLFTYDEIPMALLSDTNYDRMRIIAPIVKQEEVTQEQMYAVLDANFHSALDARYATSNGILYATFIHPLSPLTQDQVESALRQVAALVHNFGTSYSSGELIYGQEQENEGQ